MVDLAVGIESSLGGHPTTTCLEQLSRYNAIVGAPTFDVSRQSANIQQAYDLYRLSIDYIGGSSAIEQFAGGCDSGPFQPEYTYGEHGEQWPTAPLVARAAIEKIEQALALLTDSP